MTKEEFKHSLRTLPLREITDKIDYYKSFQPPGMNYQNQLNLYESELERRFSAWEACTV
jgi:hypothetical protein